MTDHDIEAATGVGASTFHRWRRGEFRQAPAIDRVRAFCAGLGVSPAEASAALGMDERRDNPEPDPPMHPKVRLILRALADPNVPAGEKAVIEEMLAMIAQRQQQHSRSRRKETG